MCCAVRCCAATRHPASWLAPASRLTPPQGTMRTGSAPCRGAQPSPFAWDISLHHSLMATRTCPMSCLRQTGGAPTACGRIGTTATRCASGACTPATPCAAASTSSSGPTRPPRLAIQCCVLLREAAATAPTRVAGVRIICERRLGLAARGVSTTQLHRCFCKHGQRFTRTLPRPFVCAGGHGGDGHPNGPHRRPQDRHPDSCGRHGVQRQRRGLRPAAVPGSAACLAACILAQLPAWRATLPASHLSCLPLCCEPARPVCIWKASPAGCTLTHPSHLPCPGPALHLQHFVGCATVRAWGGGGGGGGGRAAAAVAKGRVPAHLLCGCSPGWGWGGRCLAWGRLQKA